MNEYNLVVVILFVLYILIIIIIFNNVGEFNCIDIFVTVVVIIIIEEEEEKSISYFSCIFKNEIVIIY